MTQGEEKPIQTRRQKSKIRKSVKQQQQQQQQTEIKTKRVRW